MYYRRYDTTHLAVPQQLHNTTLIWCESSNLADDGAHKLCASRLNALAVAGLSDLGEGGRGVALVEANAKVYTPRSTSFSILPFVNSNNIRKSRTATSHLS